MDWATFVLLFAWWRRRVVQNSGNNGRVSEWRRQCSGAIYTSQSSEPHLISWTERHLSPARQCLVIFIAHRTSLFHWQLLPGRMQEFAKGSGWNNVVAEHAAGHVTP